MNFQKNLCPFNLNFGLSSSESEKFAPQILEFSGEVNGQRPFTSQKSTKDASKLPEYEGEKPKIQVCTYSFFERILRLAVFRLSVASNTFESLMMRLYVWCATTRRPFNPKRAEQTLDFLKAMGAEEKFILTRDEERIHTLIFRPSLFNKILESHGGRWETLETDKGKVFAILNEKKFDKWRDFEKNLLRFGWQKHTILGQEYLITCSHADEIDEKKQNLFLHLHSNSVAMTMLTKRIGFYLGAKQDFCLFDPRGTWKSSGIASEAGYYLDIEAIYDEIVEKEFAQHTIWLSGYCSGAYPAAHLWKNVHRKQKKVNLILENSAADLLQDFVGSLSAIVRWFAKRYWSGVKSMVPAVEETGFSMSASWKDVSHSTSAILVIFPENDQRISRSAQEKLKKIVSDVSCNVRTISFYSQSKDPHSDAFFHYFESSKKYWQTIKNETVH